MAKNGLIILALTFIVVVDSFADASIVLNFRKAILETNNSSAANLTQNSPIPAPVSGGKGLNSTAPKLEKHTNLNSTAVTHEKEKTFNSTTVKHENDKDLNATAVKHEKGKDSNSTAAKHQKEKPTDTGATRNETGSSKSVPNITGQQEGQGKRGGTIDPQSGSHLSCAGLTKNCNILNTMVACVLPSEPGSKQLSILVQSISERTLKVNFSGNALRSFEIPSHQTKKMNISLSEVKANTIVLHAENGDCAILMAPPGKNYFEELSFYSKQVTPIYGAYFSFLVVLVCGGVWACCKLRKRRWQGGAPYQELEMGLPESAAAVNENSTEGWDQGWDSDWDDDKAVMSPGGNHVGSISANGLTSRSAKKDGWEVDWED
ncbi:uncharacterized protein LOC141678337 [Apium graveolens]|uniref:uncharacterized protein LOC141678337 n=1 Tax=Apium graveolens TaxID=4045 RepID=UPI003D78B54C